MRILVESSSGERISLSLSIDNPKDLNALKARVLEGFKCKATRLTSFHLTFQKAVVRQYKPGVDEIVIKKTAHQDICSIPVTNGALFRTKYPFKPYTIQNFFELLERSRKRTYEEGAEKNILPGFSTVLQTGIYGPMTIIFSLIDPIELIINFSSVCKSFHEIVFELIGCKTIPLNKYHIFLLFNPKNHISESLFIRLCSYPDLFPENLVIEGYHSNTDYDFLTRTENTNLFKFCIEKNYFRGLKCLVEERGFTSIKEQGERSLIGTCLDNSRIDFLRYLVDHNVSGFILYLPHIEFILLKLGDFDRALKLASNPKNEHVRVEGSDSFILAYFRSLRTQREELGTLEKFLQVEKFILSLCSWELHTFSGVKNPYSILELRLVVGNLSKDVLEYLFFAENKNMGGYKFRVRKSFLYCQNFLSVVFEHLNNLDEENNLIIYLPYFQLLKYSIDGNVEEVKKMLSDKSLYDPNEDIHSQEEEILFPFYLIRNLKVVKILTDKSNFQLPIETSDEYVRAVHEENFTFADYLEPKILSTTKTAIVISNIEKNRIDVAVRVLKGSESIDLSEVFQTSLHHRCEPVIDFLFNTYSSHTCIPVRKYIDIVFENLRQVLTHQKKGYELLYDFSLKIVHKVLSIFSDSRFWEHSGIELSGMERILRKMFGELVGLEIYLEDLPSMLFEIKGWKNDLLVPFLKDYKKEVIKYLKKSKIDKFLIHCQHVEKHKVDLMCETENFQLIDAKDWMKVHPGSYQYEEVDPFFSALHDEENYDDADRGLPKCVCRECMDEFRFVKINKMDRNIEMEKCLDCERRSDGEFFSSEEEGEGPSYE